MDSSFCVFCCKPKPPHDDSAGTCTSMAKHLRVFTTKKPGQPHFFLALFLLTSLAFVFLAEDTCRLASIAMTTAVELTKVAVLLCALALVRRSMHSNPTTAIVPIESETGSTTTHEEGVTLGSNSKVERDTSTKASPEVPSVSTDMEENVKQVDVSFTAPEVTPEIAPQHADPTLEETIIVHGEEDRPKPSVTIAATKTTPASAPRRQSMAPRRTAVATKAVLHPIPERAPYFHKGKEALPTAHAVEAESKPRITEQNPKKIASCKPTPTAVKRTENGALKSDAERNPSTEDESHEEIAPAVKFIGQVSASGVKLDAPGRSFPSHAAESKAKENFTAKQDRVKTDQEQRQQDAKIERMQRYRYPVFFRVLHCR